MPLQKQFAGAPFGVQSSRFDVSGVHPKRKLPGTITQVAHSASDSKIGPGYYDIITDSSDFSEKKLEANASGPGWQRAYEVSRLASMPHLLYKDQWELKREQKRKLGPGKYEIDDFLTVESRKPRSQYGILNTLEKRFYGDERADSVPGPGSYGKGGVPAAFKEEMDHKRKSASTTGMLTSGGSGSRSLPATGCHLGPGTYNLKNNTEELMKKMTSVRGPYDLFTGDRTKPMKSGHFADMPSHNLGPGQYSLKSSLDQLERPERVHHGRFLKTDQYPDPPHERVYWFTLAQVPRNPEHQVGPATYNPQNPTAKKDFSGKNAPGFLSSASRQDKQALAFFTKNFNPVGPGRYDIQRIDDTRHINCHKSDFISKTGNPTLHEEKVMRERLRAKDIPPHQKHLVNHVSTEAEPCANMNRIPKLRSLTIA